MIGVQSTKRAKAPANFGGWSGASEVRIQPCIRFNAQFRKIRKISKNSKKFEKFEKFRKNSKNSKEFEKLEKIRKNRKNLSISVFEECISSIFDKWWHFW